MIREKDLEKILEDIKDMFYEEVDVDLFDPPSNVHAEINEGKFFSKLEIYLKNLLNNNEEKKIIKKVNIDPMMIQRSINYRQSLSFARNRGNGWELPTIEDFENLHPSIKSKFHDDIFWSSTAYDDQKMYCFSFVKNTKIIMNKGFYCNLALKRII